MNKTLVIVIGVVLLISLMLFSTTYTVKYHQVGIKTRFGQATGGVITESGLGFKWPKPIDSVIILDKRLQMLETPTETIQTLDGQQLVVRAFLLWKVDDQGDGPLRFYNSYAKASAARESLRHEFRTAVKRGVSGYRFNDLIGPQSKIAEVEATILKEMGGILEKGVYPATVGFNQMSLPAKTISAVLNRMNTERKEMAEIVRIKGTAESERIKSKATNDADKIRAFANQRAEEIRAEGDILAATYLTQMSEDEELAIFLVWIDALKRSLRDTTTYIIEPSTAPWHLLDHNSQTNSNGIPVPPGNSGVSQKNTDRQPVTSNEDPETMTETPVARKGTQP